jgi:hypothetical protein
MASIVSAGTTSATALNMSADTSGILQLATNNGTVAVTIDTSQRLGIGTSPTAPLTVSSAAGGNVAQFTNVSSADLNINLTAGVTLLTPSTGILAFGTSTTERMRIDTNGRVNINSTSNLGGILQVNGNIAPTASASSYWGIDFGTSTSAGSYVTLAYGATYDMAGGAGFLWIYEQSSSVGLCLVNCAYGGTYIVSNPQNNFSTTVNTASKTNVYYNAGTGTYRIQNLSSSPTTYSYWIASMRIRQSA